MKWRPMIAVTILVGAFGVAVAAALFSGCRTDRPLTDKQKAWIMQTKRGEIAALPQSEVEWKEVLTPEQFRILRKAGIERAFSGEYATTKTDGLYRCAGCGQPLFSSHTKFDSGTGWPSFWVPIAAEGVISTSDGSFFMRRTEVVCSRCEGHLGHVFDDGPRPTGLRYCINSAALQLDEAAEPDGVDCSTTADSE